MAVTREQMLAAFSPKIFDEGVQELAGTMVRFRELSGSARDALYAGIKADAGNSAFEAKLVALTVVDEHGELIFNEQDLDALRGGGKVLLEELARIAMRLNGIGQQAQETALKN